MKPYLIKMTQKSYLDHCGANGHTALSEAISWDCGNAARILIDAKANINQDPRATAPRHCAVLLP